jgi:hypothetical protein
MIFIVFNGTFNGFDPLILLKMISTYNQRKTSVKSMADWFSNELKNNEKLMQIYFGMHPLP